MSQDVFCSFWYGMKIRGDTSSEMIMKFQDNGWFSNKTSGDPAVDRPYSNDCSVLYERLPFLSNQYAHIRSRFEILRSNFSPLLTPLGCISRDPAPKSHMAPLLIWAVSNGKPYVLYCFVIRNSWYLEIWWNLSSKTWKCCEHFLGSGTSL